MDLYLTFVLYHTEQKVTTIHWCMLLPALHIYRPKISPILPKIMFENQFSILVINSQFSLKGFKFAQKPQTVCLSNNNNDQKYL